MVKKSASTPSRKPRGKDKPHVEAPFEIRLVDTNGRPIEGRWQVKQGDNWRNSSEINFSALPLMVTTPSGQLRGIGVVARTGMVFRITS